MAVPNIIPALPINIPGNIAAPTLVSGVYQNFFQPAQQIVPLATKKIGSIDEPAYSPPVNFEIQTSG